MKNLSFPRAMIFDWDNTLVESWGAIAEAMNHTRKHFGMPQWSLEEVMAKCTRAARDSFPEWYGDRWQEAMDVYYKYFTAIQMKNLKPLKGAREILVWLKEQNVPSFVVSNKKNVYLRSETEVLGWTDLFVAIAGSMDAPRDKPAREHVDYALAKGGLKADASIWFVGDSETDIQCARNAECTAVLIGSPEMARKLGVELTFPDCTALQKLLYSLRTA